MGEDGQDEGGGKIKELNEVAASVTSPLSPSHPSASQKHLLVSLSPPFTLDRAPFASVSLSEPSLLRKLRTFSLTLKTLDTRSVSCDLFFGQIFIFYPSSIHFLPMEA